MNKVAKRIAAPSFLLLAAAIGFAIAYSTRGTQDVSQADSPPTAPSASSTPIPGITPDTNQPYWYVPYVNADRSKGMYAGQLAGLTIDPASPGRSAFEVCPPNGLTTPHPGENLLLATAPGPLGLDPKSLGSGVSTNVVPDVFLCKGEIATVAWTLSVAAGTPNVNPGGSSLYVYRAIGKVIVNHSAPRDRWVETTVGSHEVALAGPIIVVGEKEFGDCFVGAYDQNTNVSTMITATAAMSEFCVGIAQEILR